MDWEISSQAPKRRRFNEYAPQVWIKGSSTQRNLCERYILNFRGNSEKKVNDGFEVLEIAKGTWVEAIFAKEKPEVEKPKMKFDEEDEYKDNDDLDDDEDLPEDEYENDDDDDDDDDDTFDDDKLTEESYRTTFDTNPEELTLEAADVSDDDDY